MVLLPVLLVPRILMIYLPREFLFSRIGIIYDLGICTDRAKSLCVYSEWCCINVVAIIAYGNRHWGWATLCTFTNLTGGDFFMLFDRNRRPHCTWPKFWQQINSISHFTFLSYAVLSMIVIVSELKKNNHQKTYISRSQKLQQNWLERDMSISHWSKQNRPLTIRAIIYENSIYSKPFLYCKL